MSGGGTVGSAARGATYMNNLLLPAGIAVLVTLNIIDMITRQMIDSGKGFERNRRLYIFASPL
jgi:hypothetical protein